MSRLSAAHVMQRVHRCDQAAAILRESGSPLTLRQIADSMGGSMDYLERRDGQILPGEPGHGAISIWEQCEDHGCFRAKQWGWIDRGDLEQLVKAGLVSSSKEGRRLYWRWVGTVDDMAQFELALTEA